MRSLAAEAKPTLTMPPSVPLVALVVVSTLILPGCGQTTSGSADETGDAKPKQISVVATTGPVGDLVQQIGGDQLHVEVLMGPGVDPHLHRAVPSDLAKLDKADLIIYNGLHLEGRMIELLENLGTSKEVFAVTDGLVAEADSRLREPADYPGQFDPHVWHDPLLWTDCASYVADRLASFDPDHAEAYRLAAEAYGTQLREADASIRQLIESIPAQQRVLVSAHDAFYYFGHRYGLENLPLRGVSTDDQIDMGRLDEVIRFLVEHAIPAVFVETAVAPKVVESLVEPCEARGHQVSIGGELYADALGGKDSGATTVPLMLQTNANTIASALGGSKAE